MFMGQMGQYVEASVRDTTLMWIIGQSERKERVGIPCFCSNMQSVQDTEHIYRER